MKLKIFFAAKAFVLAKFFMISLSSHIFFFALQAYCVVLHDRTLEPFYISFL